MDLSEVSRAIRRVVRRHKVAFDAIGYDQSKLLELAATTGFAEHYKSHGFGISVVNPRGKGSFTVKTSTNGDPWNFSRIVASRGAEAYEIHMNLKVRSAHDRGVYCVDIGVLPVDLIPAAKPKSAWNCLDNKHLITFAEVKKLVIFPMLLAQFVGIVHEVKPKFLSVQRRRKSPHPPPTLIALGHYSGNSTSIVRAYRSRYIHVLIAENYDVRLARVRAVPNTSPFAGND